MEIRNVTATLFDLMMIYQVLKIFAHRYNLVRQFLRDLLSSPHWRNNTCIWTRQLQHMWAVTDQSV